MGTTIKNALVGAIYGAIAAIALYILGFGVELLNCACAIITCNCDSQDAIPGMWSSGSFTNILIFCTVGGAIIGVIYGMMKARSDRDAEKARIDAENSEAAKKQRENWAIEIKEKSFDVSKTCDTNEENIEAIVQTDYYAGKQMKLILEELSDVAMINEEIDTIAKSIKKGGSLK